MCVKACSCRCRCWKKAWIMGNMKPILLQQNRFSVLVIEPLFGLIEEAWFYKDEISFLPGENGSRSLCVAERASFFSFTYNSYIFQIQLPHLTPLRMWKCVDERKSWRNSVCLVGRNVWTAKWSDQQISAYSQPVLTAGRNTQISRWESTFIWTTVRKRNKINNKQSASDIVFEIFNPLRRNLWGQLCWDTSMSHMAFWQRLWRV